MKEGSELVLRSDLKKEKGFLYYVLYDEEGNILVAKRRAGRPKAIKLNQQEVKI